MFKVLIIDDEAIIRKGLKNIIHWKQYDCEVAGEASDGVEGRSLIQQLMPDIIITDIKMPGIDGLAMIREVKALIPNCKIVILTGYRDFDYVHEAMKLGAFDFVLKPSKIEDLTSVIHRAVKELRFQKDRAEEIDKLRRIFEQNIPVLREKLLYDVFYEINADQDEVRMRMELLNLKIGRFILVVAENDSEQEGGQVSPYDKHLYTFGVMNTFEEVFSDTFRVISISLSANGTGFVIQPLYEKDNYTEDINDKCVYLQEIICNCFGFTVSFAVSSPGNGVMELPLKLRECREALVHKIYMGSGAVIFYNDLNVFFKWESYSRLEKYLKALPEAVKSGDEKMVSARLNDIFRHTENLTTVNMDYLHHLYWSTILSINSIGVSVVRADHGKKDEVKDISKAYKHIEKCKNLQELNGMLKETALRVACKVNSFNHQSIKLFLRKAVDFLYEHYMEPVTLNEVAEYTFVSTSYISRMFKKCLGKNFVDFLNEIRIQKAKELLKDVRYKTYEVAEMVGIPDAHYFSRLFKRYEGVTPTEYRDLPQK